MIKLDMSFTEFSKLFCNANNNGQCKIIDKECNNINCIYFKGGLIDEPNS